MAGFRIAALERARRWAARIIEFGYTRRARRISIAVAVVLILYGIFGFVGVPIVLRHVLSNQVAASLKRPVSVGRVQFDPYRLRLEIDKLHLADRDGKSPFVDVGHIHLKASWTSLFRLAAVIAEVTVDRPEIHIARTAPQTFNFSDLLEAAPGAPAPKPAPAAPTKPFRFALSNIRVRNGDIHFDDQVVGVKHNVANIQLGVPFIASLPRDVDIYVQPLLAMVVDGSPLRIAGQTKPLSATRDTVVTLNLHALDLHRYLGYVPVKIPIGVPRGTFSCRLQVHFVDKQPAPVIAIAGRMALNQVQVNDSAGAPIVGIGHLLVTLSDIEPLLGIFHVGEIRFDGLDPNLLLNADGTTNLTPLMGAAPAKEQTAPQHAAANAPAVQSAPTAASVVAAQPAPSAAATPAPSASSAPPMTVTLDSFRIEGSSARVTDNAGAAPAKLEIAKIHFLLQNFNLNGRWSAPFEFSAGVASGGQIALKGGVDMGDRKATTSIGIDQLDLPALQGFARDAIAAKLAGGKLNAKAVVNANFAPGNFDVHVEPASVALDGFALATPNGREKPVEWKNFRVSVAQVDLASRTATVNEVRGDGIRLLVRRERDGKLNLLSLLSPPPAPRAKRVERKPERKPAVREARRGTRKRRGERRERKPRAPVPESAPWKFTVASVVFDKTDARIQDGAAPRPVDVRISPLNLRLKNVSSDFKKPIAVELDGTVGRGGAFKAAGTASIAPLRADIRINTRRLDLSPADAYVGGNVNAKLVSALLTMNGAVRVVQERGGIRAGYRGDATIGNLRVLDRLTSQDFLRWRSFSLSRIDAEGGAGKPKAHIGGVALSNFDAGIILTTDGKLNLKDITSTPGAAPAPAPSAEATMQVQATPAAAPTPGEATPPPAPKPIEADLEIGGITLQGGNVDYSDYFIQPNYSANLSDIAGKVGAFGTASAQPAEVELKGQINGNAPLDISGSVNPLAPMAFVDLTVKADGIELTGFSPYTTKYTGYPIDRGTLTVDVHYLLNQGELKAENHIVINQLTFGDKVENSTAINLPIRLAVAILKDSNGVIDLNVPISGSMSDPQFSIGSVVMHAFWNLIVKAATSPFSLIGAAFGSTADLSQVSFAPGYATLTPAATAKLDTVAKALQERSNLKLNLQGCVDPAVDRNGLRDAMVDLAIREQKLKATGGSGDPWAVKVEPDEYDKYLWRAYSAADFTKPRNFVGLTKRLPPDEMKKLMITNAKVTDADLRKLADARADVVRKYLAAKIDPARIAVAAPNLDAGAAKDGGKPTRTVLSLE